MAAGLVIVIGFWSLQVQENFIRLFLPQTVTKDQTRRPD